MLIVLYKFRYVNIETFKAMLADAGIAKIEDLTFKPMPNNYMTAEINTRGFVFTIKKYNRYYNRTILNKIKYKHTRPIETVIYAICGRWHIAYPDMPLAENTSKMFDPSLHLYNYDHTLDIPNENIYYKNIVIVHKKGFVNINRFIEFARIHGIPDIDRIQYKEHAHGFVSTKWNLNQGVVTIRKLHVSNSGSFLADRGLAITNFLNTDYAVIVIYKKEYPDNFVFEWEQYFGQGSYEQYITKDYDPSKHCYLIRPDIEYCLHSDISVYNEAITLF